MRELPSFDLSFGVIGDRVHQQLAWRDAYPDDIEFAADGTFDRRESVLGTTRLEESGCFRVDRRRILVGSGCVSGDR